MGSSSSDTVGVIIVAVLSSFASAILIALAFAALYLYRYSPRSGWLDFLGRPGEFDDEQAFLKEEAEALETMDEMQKTEYLRAKGAFAIHCARESTRSRDRVAAELDIVPRTRTDVCFLF